MMSKLDKTFSSKDGHFKLFSSLYTAIAEKVDKLEESTFSTRLNLLKSIDVMKRKVAVLEKIVREKSLLVKKLIARRVIASIKFPICISSPSDKKKMSNI
jgi:hypothetical protein